MRILKMKDFNESLNMEKEKILFKCIVGSMAFQTNTPQSDEDIKGIYAQHPDELMMIDGYVQQYSVNKDECYYEIKRFLELARKANPTILEILFSDKDCILEKDPSLDILFENKNNFLTKKCLESFKGFAYSQIKGGTGKNLLHARRAIDMAAEIATEGTINIKRKNFKFLIDIRNGKYDEKSLILDMEKDIENLNELFHKSSLPEELNLKFVNDVLLQIRKNVKWE